jgi:hypothetical protein
MLMALVQTRRRGLKQDSLTSIVSTSDGSIGVAVATASSCVGAACCMHACCSMLQRMHALTMESGARDP